jgi:uncharacterized protein with GYD domain
MEVAMKYVLLGNLSPEWASKQSERIGKAKAKLDKLGIKIESIHYTQGYYDFVDIVDAPNQEAMLAFSIWYATQGLGRIQVCRPSTQRASKPRSRTQRAKRRWSPPSGSFDLGSVAPSPCVLASDQPSRMLAFMLIRGHLAQCRRDQGGNNVQRAILAQWRRPHDVWGSDIPRVRRRVLFSGLRE